MLEKINKKIISLAPSKTLADFAQKTKFALLAEKFLVSIAEKNKAVLLAIKKREQSLHLFHIALTFLPLGLLASLFVPTHFFAKIIHCELYCRLFVTLVLSGLIFCTFFSTGVQIMLLFFPICLFYCFFRFDESFYTALFATDFNTKMFCSVGFGLCLPQIIYLPIYLLHLLWCKWAKRVVSHRFFASINEKQLQQHLDDALENAKNAKSEELQKLIKDYAPEYTAILDELKDKQVAIDAFNDVADTSIGKKGMVLPIFLGGTQAGKPVYVDLDASPHMLVAGTTGGGKSNFVEHYICSLLEKGGCKLYIIDPSDDLYGYAGNTAVEYITCADAARNAIKNLKDELAKRAEIFRSKKGVRKISQWRGNDAPERLFVIFDEFASFAHDDRLIQDLVAIVRLGRKYGIHVLLATQSPRAGVFAGQIKDNINTRLAFRAATQAHAAVLGEPLARSIKESQKGVAVFQNELVQTPLCNNQHWWDELGGDPLPQRPEILVEKVAGDIEENDSAIRSIIAKHLTPASEKQGDFLTASAVVKYLNLQQEKYVFKDAKDTGKALRGMGFGQQQKRIKGKPKRGYFVQKLR